MVESGRLTDYLGKVNRSYLNRIIYPRLGASRREVVVGPKFGVDNAVIKMGPRNVLVATTDPLSYIPRLRPRESAWLSVHLLASDLTTSGFAPQYGIFDFNLPPEMGNEEFAKYWKAFSAECDKLGLSIVGGHTGRYQGCGYSVIGGGVMYSVGHEDSYVTSAMGQKGDDLILTKGFAVETTAVLTRAFPRTIKKVLGDKLFEKSWRYLREVSTVKDALAAASIGVHSEGVTAMHDATEGGVIAGVFEVAAASGLGAELDLTNISVSEETTALCKFFRINPLTSLSEGTLIIAVRPNRTSRVLGELESVGIWSQVIGELSSKSHSVWAKTKKGRVRIAYPRFDPYWKAYWKGTSKRLK